MYRVRHHLLREQPALVSSHDQSERGGRLDGNLEVGEVHFHQHVEFRMDVLLVRRCSVIVSLQILSRYEERTVV